MKKRLIAAVLALVLLFTFLGGCSHKLPEEEKDPGIIPVNDGHSAVLVLGLLERDSGWVSALEEIIAKYRADLPETHIELRAFPSEEDLDEALRSGEIDLAEVNSERLLAQVSEGLLLDIYPYLCGWEEFDYLTPEAGQAVQALGQGRAYLIPNDFTHDLIYYRKDWFGEFNRDREVDLARCNSWYGIVGGDFGNGDIPGTSQRMGERGKLAFAGREKLVDYFDSITWGAAGLSKLADLSAAAFAAEEEGTTIYSLGRTANGATQFLRVMQQAAIPEAMDWTTEEAVEAFVQGEAGMLLADNTILDILQERMSPKLWTAAEFPRGLNGMSIAPHSFTGWGISARTEEPLIAAHFLTYLSNSDNNTHFARVCGTLPIHIEAAAMEPSFTRRPGMTAEIYMFSRSEQYQFASEPILYRAMEGYREQLEERLRDFIAGELPREELMAWLDDYWLRAYAEEGCLWK